MVTKPKRKQSIKPIKGHTLQNFIDMYGYGIELCTCQVFQTHDMVFAPDSSEVPDRIEDCPYK